jgi:urease accessory protein
MLLAVGVAVHAMLHGQEASGSASELLGWWIGAALASAAVVGATVAVLRQSKPAWGLALAAGLAVGGGLLALAPLV